MTDQSSTSLPGTDEDTISVLLLDVPVGLYQDTRELYDELRHELFLVVQRSNPESTRLRAIVEALEQGGPLGALGHLAIETALEQGDHNANLEYAVHAVSAELIRNLSVLLEEADEYCRREVLLSRPPAPDVLDFRRWFLNEFVDQAGGIPPTPWGVWLEARTSKIK